MSSDYDYSDDDVDYYDEDEDMLSAQGDDGVPPSTPPCTTARHLLTISNRLCVV